MKCTNLLFQFYKPPCVRYTYSTTYIDQSKVVFIHGKLFRSNLLFQSRGIGALQGQQELSSTTVKTNMDQVVVVTHLTTHYPIFK